MLETSILNLIRTILSVRNSHKETTDKPAMLSRNWEFIFSDWEGWVVLYCTTKGQLGGYWLYPMLHPKANVERLKAQLPSYSMSTPSAAYDHIISRGNKHRIEPCWGKPKDFTRSEIPLLFHRQHYGRTRGKENYIEFNQLVTHPLDLHWSPEKNSYCKTNEQGEEIEKIRILDEEQVTLILMRRKTLDKLLYLGKWVLVRYVDFTRFRIHHPSYNNAVINVFQPSEYEAKFEIRECGNDYIEFRGAQIEKPRSSKKKLLSWEIRDEEEEKKYARFIVVDWKNKTILKNYSIEPQNFANYFTESQLPFETSPIFFKAEVLDLYKNNPDKYELTERSIDCRGGWHLETYDINHYNQVHTYAVYLARLPYKEQLHWLQYNEKPKGPISERAFQTDFEGNFPSEVSKLEMLRQSLEKLGNVKIGNRGFPVWSPKGGSWISASKGLHYVNSENSNQWHDFIIALANVTNEGFQIKPLRELASIFGDYDKKLGTLGLIKYILQSSNHGANIPTIHGVLNELQEKRGKGKAHGTWATPKGSLIKDANKRLQDVAVAIQQLTGVLEKYC